MAITFSNHIVVCSFVLTCVVR